MDIEQIKAVMGIAPEEKWQANPGMKDVITGGDGYLVVHDEYGLMSDDIIARIVCVPELEAAVIAQAALIAELVEALEAIAGPAYPKGFPRQVARAAIAKVKAAAWT